MKKREKHLKMTDKIIKTTDREVGHFIEELGRIMKCIKLTKQGRTHTKDSQNRLDIIYKCAKDLNDRCCNMNVDINEPPVVMKFRDAPIGARFKYNDDSPIWVKIHSNEGTDGLIVRWHGNVEGFQNYASHCDEFACVDFDTEIFVL